MAMCAFCKTQIAQLYENDVPICLDCANGRAKRRPPVTDQQIRANLLQNILDLSARINKASAEFNEVVSQIPSNLPHPDGAQRIKNASAKLASARKELMKAHRRLDEHTWDCSARPEAECVRKYNDFMVERRSKVRFPLQLPVSYRTLERESTCSGEGWVVNMNRGGVLVSSQQEISVGTRMELSIEWPSPLYGRVPLRFVTVGKVVRCDASSFAVKLVRYQFRTAKTKVTSMKVTSMDALGSINH